MLTTALHPDFGAQIDGIDLRGGETEFVSTLASWQRPEVTYSHRWSPGDVLIWGGREVCT